jgi:exonuclease SbcC
MFNFIEVKNFQSHKNSLLNFHPGVNAIVGTSDSGKSAIIRAVRWLWQNRPLGDSFRSHWITEKDPTSVRLQVEGENTNQPIITRHKRTTVYNIYRIDDAPVMEGFGTSVPEEIVGILNMDSLNLQGQHDNPAFLLSESPGEVARVLNRTVRLDVLDEAVRLLSRDVRRNRGEAERARGDVKERKAELRETEWVVEAEEALENAEALHGVWKAMEERCDDLSSILYRSREVEGLIQDLTPVIRLKPRVEKVERLHRGLAASRESSEVLRQLADNLDNTEGSLRKAKKEAAGAKKRLARIGKAQENVSVWREVSASADDLEQSTYRLAEVLEGIKTAHREKAQAERDFHRLMPDVCPLCGQEVPK